MERVCANMTCRSRHCVKFFIVKRQVESATLRIGETRKGIAKSIEVLEDN